MKTKNRFTKALGVIVIVGIGLIYNMNLKINMNDSTQSDTSITEESQIKTDTVVVDRNKIYIYTKSIIRSGIQHLISNL